MNRLILASVLLVFTISAYALNNFRSYPDSGGLPSFIRLAPDYIDALVLTASVSATDTIPAGANRVIFSASCSAFYAKPGASAAVPVANVTDGTAAELNPASWHVTGYTQITVIAPVACIVTLSYYK